MRHKEEHDLKKERDLLIVIDLQNVYLPGEEWMCPSMREAVKNICTLLDSGTVEQAIFTRFTAPQKPQGTWKNYNEVNAEVNADARLNEMVEEIRPYLGRYPLYDKSTYSSMRIAALAEAAKRADRILLSGVVAECCVLATMLEAIDDGHRVVYLTDCVSGQSEANEMAIRRIAESFAPVHTEVMDSRTWIAQARAGQKVE